MNDSKYDPAEDEMEETSELDEFVDFEVDEDEENMYMDEEDYEEDDDDDLKDFELPPEDAEEF